MSPDPRLQQIEDACAQLLAAGEQITFDEVAARTGLGRATIYRNPQLRATVEEHRTRGREAHTFKDLANQIAHLRTALDGVAANVRRHEEELRKLRRPERQA
jgi:hypothetical protein